MSFARYAAILAASVLGAVCALQLLLAAGAPLGHLAWGGQHRVLPRRLRWGSAAAIPVLCVAAWVVLARVGLAGSGTTDAAVRLATWVFVALFALNTLGNLRSRSRVERIMMSSVTVLLVGCFLVAALDSGRPGR